MTRILIESAHKDVVVSLVENSLAIQQKMLQTGLKRTKARLQAFEKEFGESSQKFYRAYQAGRFADRRVLCPPGADVCLLSSCDTDNLY